MWWNQTRWGPIDEVQLWKYPCGEVGLYLFTVTLEGRLGSKEGVGILGYRLAFREENTPDQESPSLEWGCGPCQWHESRGGLSLGRLERGFLQWIESQSRDWGLTLPAWNTCPKPQRDIHVSYMAQLLKKLPAMQETWVRSLGQKDQWLPTPVFFPGEFHGWREDWRTTVRGITRSQTRPND